MAVIGGGLTGLVAAEELARALPQAEIALFEATDRAGGVLWTERHGDWVVERGADSFLTETPEALALCDHLALSEELVSVAPTCRRALVVHEGRLTPVPEGWSLMAPTDARGLWASPLLSRRGKLRVLAERFVPARKTQADESFEEFALRRIGREAYERLAQPLVAGIYTADPQRLSMAAALPRWWAMEREYGSLRAGLAAESQARRETAGGARYGLFATPRGGLGRIVEELVVRLPPGALRLATRVTGLRRSGDQWLLTTEPQKAISEAAFDAVALCLPAPMAGQLLSVDAPQLGAELAAIPYADSAIVVLRYAEKQLRDLPPAAGFVVPAVERRPILAASFSSAKFPGRAAPGEFTVRVFLGGALDGAIVERHDAELAAIAARELGALLGISGPPREAAVVRWRQAMPQYVVGHLDRVAAIERLREALPRLALAGNAYHGVGIGHCIRSGQNAARWLVDESRKRQRPE